MLATYFTLISYLAFSSTLKMEAIFSSETSVDFDGLYVVVSLKIEPFTTTAVIISDPIECICDEPRYVWMEKRLFRFVFRYM
jgi:hypothetical protein